MSNTQRKIMKCLIVVLSIVLIAALGVLIKLSMQPAKETPTTPTSTPVTTEINPDTLTLEEYEKLSPAQKEALRAQFASEEAFNQWLEKITHLPPWERGGILPDAYTWDAYCALSPEHQKAFAAWFSSSEAFNQWLKNALPPAPWETGGKQPDAYTWEEYQALSKEEQDTFFLWFDTREAFEAWMRTAKNENTTEPSETDWSGTDKTPDKYTWAEYQALSPQEQEAFYQWFGTKEAFESWMESVKPVETTQPPRGWDKPGKKPNEYTWAEYQALSHEEQDAFYQWFGSEAAFEAWMESAKPAETTQPPMDWDKPGKQPDEYTWEEYEALSPQEQEAFYQWFDSKEAFESWMKSAKPEQSTEPPAWDKPGKKPDEYTWEEYEALTPEEQEAFYLWFGSKEAFEAWMETAKPAESTDPPTWDKPGKEPDEYTWEEYQALTPEEQEAFYLWFDSREAFEAWMEKAKVEQQG